jgi:hypothetical protein
MTEITFITPIKKVIEKLNSSNIATDQQIYTNLPDF